MPARTIGAGNKIKFRRSDEPMSIQWMGLINRFKSRLEVVERKDADGNVKALWRLCCLEQALEMLEEDPDAASKHLDDFDRSPSATELVGISAKFPKRPSVEDIRTRFDTLGGGIV
jgi:hypothetical protein